MIKNQYSMNMKKILIFYGSYGGGHLSAAKSIEGYLKKEYNSEVEIQTVDCIEYINKYINKVSTGAYKELAKKAPWAWKQVYKHSQNGALSHISNTTNRLMSLKLNSLIKEFSPDLIISTHPFSTQMCAILKKRKKINCKLATILTDYHTHPQWLVLHQYTDAFFVSNDQMKLDMISEGIDINKIFVTGIPVSERFSEDFNKQEIYDYFGLTPKMPTVLFFAGGEFGLGRDTTFMTLKALIRMFKSLQVVAISGKNKKMNKKFNELVEKTKSSDRVKVLDYTNKVPELMNISMGVITKPGGLTVTESLVSGLPIVVINPIPGQEEENAEFLVNNNIAIWIKKGDNIARALKTLSRNPDQIKQMSENALAFAKPDATADICNTLINQFADFENIKNTIVISAEIINKGKCLYIKEINQNTIFGGEPHLFCTEIEVNKSPEESLINGLMHTLNLEVKQENLKPISFDSKLITHKKRKLQIINLKYRIELDTINIVNSSGKELIWK